MNWYKIAQEIFRGDQAKITMDEYNPEYATKVLKKDLGSSASEGPGIYFVTEKDIALGYGPHLTSKKLNNANILTFEHPPFSKQQILKIIQKVNKDTLQLAASNWDENYNRGLKMIIDSILQNNTAKDQLMSIWAEIFQHQNPNAFMKLMVENGIDGISKEKNDAVYYVIYNRNVLQ